MITENTACPMNTCRQVAPSSESGPHHQRRHHHTQGEVRAYAEHGLLQPFLTCAATHIPDMQLGMTPATPVQEERHDERPLAGAEQPGRRGAQGEENGAARP